jgi:hypothetical protein
MLPGSAWARGSCFAIPRVTSGFLLPEFQYDAKKGSSAASCCWFHFRSQSIHMSVDTAIGYVDGESKYVCVHVTKEHGVVEV